MLPVTLRLAALALLLLAAPAYACEARGGSAGPAFVFVLHEGAGEKEVGAAVEAIRGSPLGTREFRTFVAQVGAAACERVTKDSLVPYLRCGQQINEAIATCAEAGAKIVVLSGLDFTSRSSVTLPRDTAGVFVSTKGAPSVWTRDLLHELGHAFGLRDERPILTSRQKSLAATPGPNCAANEDEARRRWGDLAAKGEAGFHKGCAGNAAWLRPHARTIMDAPRSMPEWGAVNARYLRDAVRCCFSADRKGCAEAAGRNPELAACVK